MNDYYFGAITTALGIGGPLTSSLNSLSDKCKTEPSSNFKEIKAEFDRSQRQQEQSFNNERNILNQRMQQLEDRLANDKQESLDTFEAVRDAQQADQDRVQESI